MEPIDASNSSGPWSGFLFVPIPNSYHEPNQQIFDQKSEPRTEFPGWYRIFTTVRSSIFTRKPIMEDRTVPKFRTSPELATWSSRKFVGSLRGSGLVPEQIRIRTTDRTKSKRLWAPLLEKFPYPSFHFGTNPRTHSLNKNWTLCRLNWSHITVQIRLNLQSMIAQSVH